MLNELVHLAGALEGAGVTPSDLHKDLKPLPNATKKKPCYKILLTERDGKIVIDDIQETPLELVGKLRKWEQSNGSSFPGFNIQPLFRVADDERKAILKKWKERKEKIDIATLRSWIDVPEALNWDEKSAKKTCKCLKDIPEDLAAKLGDIPSEALSVKKVIARARALDFFASLREYLWRQIEVGDRAPELLSVLIHEGSSEKKAKDDRGSVSVYLDVPDWEEYPVAHEKTMGFLNARLLGHAVGDNAESIEKDAFAKDRARSDNNEKLPSVKLPILGSVSLRAMNKESPCQTRYGLIDAASFPIGQKSRKRAKSALEWLSDSSREDQTWGKADGKELLFAYPSIIPPSSLALTGFMGTRQAGDNTARFESYAKDVIANLKLLGKPLRDVELRVFALRKMDKARTKVVFYRDYTAQRLADAAMEWKAGCENLPFFLMPAWGEKKGETLTAYPQTPFPLQIADCLNRVWKLDGTTECEVSALDKTVGVELLLELSARQVPYLLTLALQNGKGLFLSLGNALHRNERVSLKGYDKHKQLMLPILGLLLHKLGIGKEWYMTRAPYLVGNMLKVSDDLHVLYCKEVRDDSLPPQLLGNALMVAALDNPTQALSLLSRRLAPYLGWARTNRSKSSDDCSHLMKRYEEISAALKGQSLPSRLNDAERAQLLLGYLATMEKNEDNTEEKENSHE